MTTEKIKKEEREVKRHRRISPMILVMLLLLFFVVSFSYLYNHSKNPIYKKPKVESNTQDDNVNSIRERNDNNFISVSYPVFGKENIDSILERKVNEYIDAFKSRNDEYVELSDTTKADLKIGYESFEATENIVSVLLKASERKAFEDEYTTENCTFVFDFENDKEISLDEIFKGRYLNYISSYIGDLVVNYSDETDVSYDKMRDTLYPSLENFSKFICDENKITFYFDKKDFKEVEVSGSFGFEIPYYDMYGYFKSGYLDCKVEQDEYMYSQIFGPVDDRVPCVAITFDDGPGKYTEEIVSILREHNSVATFFMLGERLDLVEPSTLDDLLTEGSTINSHSYSHSNFKKLSAESIKQDMIDTKDKIYDITGGYEIRFFRPPYGSYNDTVKENVPYPLVMWSVDTMDWDTDDPNVVYENATCNIQDGDVILLHEVHDSTVEALPRILEELQNQGFQTVTIEEMYDMQSSKLKRGVIIE